MFDTSKLKNNKFYSGSYKNFKNTREWFLGSFFNTENPLKTDKLEIIYFSHKVGDIIKPHYHKEKVELLIFIKGKARFKVNQNVVILKGGDFLFIDVNNIIEGEYLKTTEGFAIHSPSLPKDKYFPDNR